MAGGSDNLVKIGDKFGIYDVVRELGHGGMGAVYLVRDPQDGTELAAKVMYPESAATHDYFVKRFIREAEIAMAVRHPNLIRVYDVGRDPDTGLGYMLMDYVPGGSLKDRLMRRLIDRKGPFPVQEALAVVRQIAAALDAAAVRGIVHRDVKPDNILFDADGTPKLADLGVAKVAEGDASTLLTMSSVVVGTPAYMAPEQMTNSHAADQRADVYSLGLVLWEMLAGERPTAGASAAELMARAVRLERIPDIRTKRKGLPGYVLELLRRMTEPRVERRLSSPGEVVHFIADWRERERRRMRAWLVGLVAVGGTLLLTLLGGGIWYVAVTADERQVPNLDLEIKRAKPSTLDSLTAKLETNGSAGTDVAAASSSGTEAKATPPAVAEPVPTAKPNNPAEAAPKVKMIAPVVADRSQMDDVLTEYRRLAAEDPDVARKTINDAVNAARGIDPDLSIYYLDGRPKMGGDPLPADKAAICRKGMAFLRLEMFRKRNARLPTDAEAKALLEQ